MPAKAFVIFFRYKYLLLAPFLVTLPLAIAFVALSGSTKYQTSGKVSVNRPAFLASEATSGWNPYISLAANQANFVRQKLKTNEFSDRVAQTASDGFSRPISGREVRSGSWAAELGPNLLAIGYMGGDPEAARRIAAAVITEYGKVELEQTTADAKLALDVREADVAARGAIAIKSSQAVTNYLDRHPEFIRDVRLADLDPQLRTLADTQKEDNQRLRDAETDLSATKAFVESTITGQTKTFEPIEADAPETPAFALARKKTALVGPPIMAILAALSLSAVVYGFLFRTDRSLRSREDLASAFPNITFLGSVPDVAAPKRRNWPRDFVRVTATSGDDVEDALRRMT